MTRRRSSYRSLSSLQRDNWVCRACAEAGYPLESLPVVQPYTGQRAYVYGQAPGVLEGQQRLPWRGDAGRRLRRWLEMDENRFYATFYCASGTRCYPGRSPKCEGDRSPSAPEQKLCSLWREWELKLIQPDLVLVVGTLSIKALLGLSTLACVGTRFDLNDMVAIPLPHSSGTSRWLNDPVHQQRLDEALILVRDELDRLGLGG